MPKGKSTFAGAEGAGVRTGRLARSANRRAGVRQMNARSRPSRGPAKRLTARRLR